MKISFENKTGIVTGGALGIGKEIVSNGIFLIMLRLLFRSIFNVIPEFFHLKCLLLSLLYSLPYPMRENKQAVQFP